MRNERIDPRSNSKGQEEKEALAKEKKEQRRKQLYEKEKEEIKKHFSELGPLETVCLMKSKLDLFREIIGERGYEELEQKLDLCAGINKKEDFIATVFETIKFFIDLRIDEAEKFEAAHRDFFLQKNRFIKVNELVSYRLDEGDAHIHIAPNETTNKNELLALFSDGMKMLARILDKQVDDGIQVDKVTATSTLVKKFSNILNKRYGFTVSGEIPEEFRNRHFAGSKPGEVYGAYIPIEEFFKKYL